MLSLLKKVFFILRHRPLQFFGLLGQTLRFYRASAYRFFFPLSNSRIFTGTNVRIQRVSCLSAELPSAKITIGDNSIIYEKALIGAYGKGEIKIGSDSIIGEARILGRDRITIGDRFLTSWNVYIQDFDPHPISPEKRAEQMKSLCANFKPGKKPPHTGQNFQFDFPSDPISIGNDVWVGANVTILKGAIIGDGCVIATGAVVVKGSYPARSILAGIPAKAVKPIDEPRPLG